MRSSSALQIDFVDAIGAQAGGQVVRMGHRCQRGDWGILQLRHQSEQGVEILRQPLFLRDGQIEAGEVGEMVQLSGFDGHGLLRDKTAILQRNRLVPQACAR